MLLHHPQVLTRNQIPAWLSAFPDITTKLQKARIILATETTLLRWKKAKLRHVSKLHRKLRKGQAPSKAEWAILHYMEARTLFGLGPPASVADEALVKAVRANDLAAADEALSASPPPSLNISTGGKGRLGPHQTVLHVAVAHNNPELAGRLHRAARAQGFNLAVMVDAYGRTPLTLAAELPRQSMTTDTFWDILLPKGFNRHKLLHQLHSDKDLEPWSPSAETGRAVAWLKLPILCDGATLQGSLWGPILRWKQVWQISRLCCKQNRRNEAVATLAAVLAWRNKCLPNRLTCSQAPKKRREPDDHDDCQRKPPPKAPRHTRNKPNESSTKHTTGNATRRFATPSVCSDTASPKSAES